MFDVRITVVRKASYPDLSARYENPIEHACDVREGQSFVAVGGEKPEGLCDSAWESMAPFAKELARGGGDFYGSRAEVMFCHWLRAERQFGSQEKLRRQLQRDAERSAELLTPVS